METKQAAEQRRGGMPVITMPEAVGIFRKIKRKETLLFNGQLETESFSPAVSSGFEKSLDGMLSANRFRKISCNSHQPKIGIIGLHPADESVSSAAELIKSVYLTRQRNFVPDFLDFMLESRPYQGVEALTLLAERIYPVLQRHGISPIRLEDKGLGYEEQQESGRLMNLLHEPAGKNEAGECIRRIMEIHIQRIKMMCEKLEEQSRKMGYSLALVDIRYFCDYRLFRELEIAGIHFLAACWAYNTVEKRESNNNAGYKLTLPESRWKTAGRLFERFEEILQKEVYFEKNEPPPEIRRGPYSGYAEIKKEYKILGGYRSKHKIFTANIVIARKKEGAGEKRAASFEVMLPAYLDREYGRLVKGAMQQM